MAPQLFRRQLDAGAWGITLATAHQTRIAYQHGVRRVLMANQLVGKQNMAIVAELLAVQGSPADIGGYFQPDPLLVEAVMRPSKTFNDAVGSLG